MRGSRRGARWCGSRQRAPLTVPATSASWKCEPFLDGVPLAYHASFDAEQFAKLQQGLVPREMEDKWFVYYSAPFLYLHRSWSGKPVYRVEVGAEGAGARGVRAELSKARGASESELAHQALMLDFLISNLLLGESKPFPRPPGL